jgi:hypothetical protein
MFAGNPFYTMKKYITLAAVIFFGFAAHLAAQGWTKPRGDYYTQITYGAFETGSEFGLSGSSVPLLSQLSNLRNGTFTANNFYFYSEYGLIDGLTIVSISSYQQLEQRFDDIRLDSQTGRITDTLRQSTRASGFGDYKVAARFQLAAESFYATALQVGIKLPTGNASGSIPLGTGFFDIDFSLQGGAGFKAFQNFGYAAAEVGYRYRDGDAFNDEIFFSLKAGVPVFTQSVLLTASIWGVKSRGTIQPSVTGINLIQNLDLYRLSAGAAVSLTKEIGITFDSFVDVAGRNTAKGTTFLFGVYLNNLKFL